MEEILKRGIEEIIDKNFLKRKLHLGKKLRIKFGVDPTARDIHLGHTVVLRKLKKFQEMGHRIVFLIGDFTALIGDPSGQNKSRPKLSEKEIKENTKTYLDQVSKILNVKKTEIRKNSEWYKKEGWKEVIELGFKFTIARILERDDFEKRLKSGSEITLSEILYPVMQAYDSIKLKAEVEIGGTDQKFNMLMGRRLMEKMGLIPQEVITMKLLAGLDGEKKMSKSFKNYIGVTEKAADMYGKIMSIPDNQIFSYVELCTDIPLDEIQKIKNPREQKARLALEIVKMYHGEKEAKEAEKEFDRIFKLKELPANMPIIKTNKSEIRVIDFLVENNFASSKSEARRLIIQGAVDIQIEDKKKKIDDINEKIKNVGEIILKIGKRKFVKIVKI